MELAVGQATVRVLMAGLEIVVKMVCTILITIYDNGKNLPVQDFDCSLSMQTFLQ